MSLEVLIVPVRKAVRVSVVATKVKNVLNK